MRIKTIIKLFSFTSLIIILLLIFIGCNDLSYSCNDTYEVKLQDFIRLYDNYSIYDEQHQANHNKAIIIIPGILDSSLYSIQEKDNKGRDKLLWGLDSNPSELISGGMTMLNNYSQITNFNKDTIPQNPLRVGNMKDCTPYSAFGTFKNIYDYCTNRYGNSYDIICWQYDWRIHLDAVAYKLNDFINTHNYNNNVIIGHSMGCNIISRYLAIGEEQKQKVDLLIAYGGPMLGAVDANSALFNFETNVSETLISASSRLLDISSLVQNMASVYHLMATKKFNDIIDFSNNMTYFSIDNEFKSHTEWIDYLSKYDWAKGEDDSTKFVLQTLDEYNSKVFIDGKHITHFINTHYIASIGIDTSISINISYSNNKIDNIIKTNLGDGVVTMYSATAGLEWDLEDIPENVHILYDTDHLRIMSNTDVLENIFNQFDSNNS